MTRILAVDIDVAREPACRARLVTGWVSISLWRYPRARRGLRRRQRP